VRSCILSRWNRCDFRLGDTNTKKKVDFFYQAIRRKIPIRIKNVENPRGGGTVIYPDPESDVPSDLSTAPSVPEPATLKSLHDLASTTEDSERKRLPTAVTIKEHIVVLNVNSNRKSVSHGFLAGIFGTLDKFGVVVDLISTSEVHVSMAIGDGLGKMVLDRLVKELKKSGTVRTKVHITSQYPNIPKFYFFVWNRSHYTRTWLSFPSLVGRCVIWSVSPEGCSPLLPKATSISR